MLIKGASNLYQVSKLIMFNIEVLYDNDDDKLNDFLRALRMINIKLYPFESFQHSINLVNEISDVLIKSKNTEIKRSHAYFVADIFLSLASEISTEYNEPTMKKLTAELYEYSSDLIQKKKLYLYAYQLKVSLLCVQPRAEFLKNFSSFLPEILHMLKNKSARYQKVACQCLQRVMWIYCVKHKAEDYNATLNKLNSIVPIIFPKNIKKPFPKNEDVSFFVQIISSISKSKLDYAVKEIIYDLMGVGTEIKALNIKRMIIGLKSISKIYYNFEINFQLKEQITANTIKGDILLRSSRKMQESNFTPSMNSRPKTTSALIDQLNKIKPYIDDLSRSCNGILKYFEQHMKNSNCLTCEITDSKNIEQFKYFFEADYLLSEFKI
ncbi:MAG: hypothetical protein MHPSP_001258 [Paramarteilia canceri]